MESSGKKTTETRLSEYFGKAEAHFSSLILMDDLDQEVSSSPSITQEFELAIAFALRSAFGSGPASSDAHLFLQRVLYRINRLKFFWFDDLSNYKNERSDYLSQVRQRIEAVWEPWELSQVNTGLEEGSVSGQLRVRAAEDLAPTPSKEGIYFRDHMGLAGYRRLLEIASLDGLVATIS